MNLEIIKKIGFSPIKILKQDKQSTSFVIRGKLGNNPVVAKIIKKSNLDSLNALKKELRANVLLEKYCDESSARKILAAKVIKTEEDKDYFCLVRRYVDGQTLAMDNNAYDKINSKYSNNFEKILSQISKLLSSMRRTYELLSEIEKKSFTTTRFSRDIEKYSTPKMLNNIKFDLNSQLNFYQQIKKKYFSEENITLIIGDLNPGNIILKTNETVILSDYSWLCIDNYMMDVTYLWLFLWRLPKWQKSLENIFIKNNNDKIFFRASIIRLIISMGWEMDEIINDKQFIGKNKKWLSYLDAAGESFEAIIETK